MKSSTRKRFWKAIFLSAGFFFTSLLISPLIGSSPVDFRKVLDWIFRGISSVDSEIVIRARIPRALLAATAGFVLASAGASFQVLLRNPLADPFTLGVASGAAAGAIIGMMTSGPGMIAGIPINQLFAFAGALLTITFIRRFALKSGKISSNMMILAGVTISYLFSALIMGMQYLADMTQTYQITHWMMGSTSSASYMDSLRIMPFAIVGVCILFCLAKYFNALLGGEETAEARGVPTEKVKHLAFISASLATASVVSVTGPIGFVGLIVPHILRLLVGSDHRILLPCAALSGAGFMVLCDILARTIAAPAELPIGILTSLIGGPVFIYLLYSARP